MRRYFIYKRKNSPYYYAEILNPETGKYLPAKSTRKEEESEALLVVADWLKNGIPEGDKKRDSKEVFTVETILSSIRGIELTENDVSRIIETLQAQGYIESAVIATTGPENENLIQFIRRFWDYDKSPYVRDKLQHGHSITRQHCYSQLARMPHWEEHFPKARLKDISRKDLREFGSILFEKGLTRGSINKILNAGIIALKWAYHEGILKKNPAEGLRKFSARPKERGILTPEEAKKLFSSPWRNEHARVASLTACTTGARASELAGLRIDDIGGDVLHIRHSFSVYDGLKDTKTGEKRTVPLLPAIREELLQLAGSNPHGNGYIFYQAKPDKPCPVSVFRNGLKKALYDMGMTEQERAERGICFHSWRHYYITHIADRLTERVTQMAAGHKTAAMTQHYSNHRNEEHLKRISEAVQGAFGNIIEYRKTV